MPNIKSIFFDFDGVLTTDKSGSQTTIRSLSCSTGIPEAELKQAFFPHQGDLILGKTTHEAIWPDICTALGRKIELSKLIDAFDATPMNEDMLVLAKQLRPTYAVGIITDNSFDRMDHLVRRHSLQAAFSPIVTSGRIGSSKYTPNIFIQALSEAGCNPTEAVFIDNAEQNLVIARETGLHTIFHNDELNDINWLATQLRDVHDISTAA
ncbi:HAD-IA family hydrolase [Lysobacter sp. H21R4]|uniref:HAD-IA family hydrolase n=1 Tax=Lysobacter sp. H21R4 TaxID=2781021 RepID=UPI00188921ED|nr:HAD-IA family hydrolase [Lysobacter sp. H21R4]QOY63652.1 HAD-IA family hydrolase [Lysobacter sp. H21R4]